MYINGVPDYDRQGKERKTGLFLGMVTSDGELRNTSNGKTYGRASVRAYSRKDGTAAFMGIKSFSAPYASRVASLRKGDSILCAGVVEVSEYNGKQYADMMVDFLASEQRSDASAAPAENMAALASRAAAAFEPVSDEEMDESELPF